MEILLWIISSTFALGLISLIGAVIILASNKIEKILLFLVALSAGTLIGSAFLHILPEALEKERNIFSLAIAGFVLFFLIEKILHWRHCHKGKCPVHTFAYMNL